MSNSSDSEILKNLRQLENTIINGISKVNDLLQDAWNNEDLTNLREEISQSRKKLEIARNSLQESQERSDQVCEELKSTSSRASEQKTLLSQACNEGEKLYLNLQSQQEQATNALNNLRDSIQECQQYRLEFNQAIQRIEAAENLLSELDRRYNLLLNINRNLEEIIDRLGGYQSISDLVVSIREATERLQKEQLQARTMIEEFERINRRIEGRIEEFELTQRQTQRQVDALTQAQRAPWWWPRNWWWSSRRLG